MLFEVLSPNGKWRDRLYRCEQLLFFFIILIFYRLLAWSWRKKVYESPELLEDLKNRRPLILAHWHGDELALMHLVTRYRLSTMTSTSQDGQLADFVIQSLGGKTSKGSSTRGGVRALKGLVRLCKGGYPSSMAVDAPKGPIHQVKPGVFELSRLTGARIYPTGVYSQKPYVFKKSWAQEFLPLPFSRVCVFFGSPLPAIKKGQNPREEILKKRLETSLFDVRKKALNFIVQGCSKC